jgi:hypothetical protein
LTRALATDWAIQYPSIPSALLHPPT